MTSGKRWSSLVAVVLAALLFAPAALASIPSAADVALAPPTLPELAPASIEAIPEPETCGVFCQRLDVRLEAGLFGGGEVSVVALDAWGNYRNPAELEASKNRFGFTGHLFDRETGTYYAKARYFDPGLGRFLSQDSYLGEIDSPTSLHRYAYGWNRPTFWADSTGHAPGDWYDPRSYDWGAFGREAVGRAAYGVCAVYSFGSGVSESLTSNFAPLPRVEDPNAFRRSGQVTGDVVSLALATAEAAAGGTIAGGGSAITVLSGGTLAPASVPATLALAGVATAGHGIVAATQAIDHSSKAIEGGGGGSRGTRPVVVEEARQAKQAAAPKKQAASPQEPNTASVEIHAALFPKQAKSKSLSDLKEGIRKRIRARHARG